MDYLNVSSVASSSIGLHVRPSAVAMDIVHAQSEASKLVTYAGVTVPPLVEPE